MTVRAVNRCTVCNHIITDDDDEFREGKDNPDLCNDCNDAYGDKI